MKRDRLKREKLRRTGPIRSRPIATQMLERGVETAYMVVEEYMLRGRQAADRRHAGHDRHERPTMNNDRGNSDDGGGYGDGFRGQSDPFPPGMMPFIQMMRMWADSMSLFMPGGAMMANWMNQFTPGAGAWAGTPTTTRAITVHVSSRDPAEVTVDLESGAEYARLRVEPLTSLDDLDAPPLASVGFECTPGHVRVRVTVPNDQPVGEYLGDIFDATGSRRGELRVLLEKPAGAAKPRPAARATRKGRPRKSASARVE